MRYLVFIIALFAALQTNAQNNIVYGAGINYTNGAPTFIPPVRTSRVAIDTVNGKWYHFNTPGGWQLIGNTIEEIAGCTAPAYTPGKGDSKVVINNCSPQPELYFYNGSAWLLVGGGSVYAGEGIRIENDTIILDSLYILRFRTGSNTDGAAGAMSWNATEETVDLVTDQGAVTGHLMESAYYNTRNTTGSSIVVGTVVMANGTTGNTGRILIAPAIADGSVNSEYILGLAAQTIGNNSNGKVQHFGKIRGIQTNGANFGETWVDGDVLYCSASTPGYLTKVLPNAPNLKVPIAIVIHAHPSNGTLFVRPSHFPDLAQINDVQLSSPTNGQVLTYNSTLSRWENATPANQLQTLSTDGSAGNISISSGNTITLNVNDADASATNELQTLSVAANTATLSNSGGSVTIAGAGINTVGTAGTTITVTGTEVDGSTTNELQTLSTGTNTLTLSNGGGTVTVDTNPADDVTGSGANGQVSFWTGAQTQGGDNGLFWDNTNKRLFLGAQYGNGGFNQTGSSNVFYQNTFSVNSGESNYWFARRSRSASIGTSSTTNNLDYLGLLYFQGVNTSNAFQFGSYIEARQNGAAGAFVPTNLSMGTYSSTAINSNQLVLNSNSNVGISILAPAARLHVVGSGTSSSTWTAQFHNSAGNNNALMIRDDGNIGIGTNAPLGRLDIVGTAAANALAGLKITNLTTNAAGVSTRIELPVFNGNAGGIIEEIGNSVDGYRLNIYQGQSSGTVSFGSGGNNERMRIASSGNIGIGTTSPNGSAILDISSTTRGLLFPRMTTAQRDLIATPADGLVIYNTTDNKLQVRAAGAWVDLH